jgi:AcrR family transcriptional regulator
MNTAIVIPMPDPLLHSRLTEKSDQDVALQIVDAFSRRAQTVGIRSISMSDLATQLRISTKTLYKYFSNKGELVHELIVR